MLVFADGYPFLMSRSLLMSFVLCLLIFDSFSHLPKFTEARKVGFYNGEVSSSLIFPPTTVPVSGKLRMECSSSIVFITLFRY